MAVRKNLSFIAGKKGKFIFYKRLINLIQSECKLSYSLFFFFDLFCLSGLSSFLSSELIIIELKQHLNVVVLSCNNNNLNGFNLFSFFVNGGNKNKDKKSDA